MPPQKKPRHRNSIGDEPEDATSPRTRQTLSPIQRVVVPTPARPQERFNLRERAVKPPMNESKPVGDTPAINGTGEKSLELSDRVVMEYLLNRGLTKTRDLLLKEMQANKESESAGITANRGQTVPLEEAAIVNAPNEPRDLAKAGIGGSTPKELEEAKAPDSDKETEKRKKILSAKALQREAEEWIRGYASLREFVLTVCDFLIK